MEQGGHTHSPALAVGILFLPPFLFPLELPCHCLQAFFQTTCGNVKAHGGDLVGKIAVYYSKFIGVKPRHLSKLIHIAFHDPGGLWVAISPHGLTIGVIGVNHFCFIEDIGYSIKRRESHHHHARGRRAPRSVRPIVQDHPHIPKFESSFFIASLDNICLGRLPRRGRLEFFFPIQHDLHRPTCFVGQKNSNIFVAVRIQTRPKSAPQGWNDYSGVFALKAHRY